MPITPNPDLTHHSEKQAKVSLIIQLFGLIGILILASYVIWASVTSSERDARELAAQVKIDFELAKAEICAIAGLLSLDIEERSDEVQNVVDGCLNQVDLPGVEIEVPTENGR